MHYTVQCGFAAYYTNTVTVEADSLDEALKKAVTKANQSSSWPSTDYSGPAFIEAVAEGEDADLWMDERVQQLPIPPRFQIILNLDLCALLRYVLPSTPCHSITGSTLRIIILRMECFVPPRRRTPS